MIQLGQILSEFLLLKEGMNWGQCGEWQRKGWVKNVSPGVKIKVSPDVNRLLSTIHYLS